MEPHSFYGALPSREAVMHRQYVVLPEGPRWAVELDHEVLAFFPTQVEAAVAAVDLSRADRRNGIESEVRVEPRQARRTECLDYAHRAVG